MNSETQKIIINIKNNKCTNWRLLFKKELTSINSKNIEINCKNLDLSCKEIQEIASIANQYNCNVVSFCSSSSKTIVSSQALGYQSHLMIGNYSISNSKLTDKDINLPKTDFHQGTVRSGEYICSNGDLLILGDVNPGAIVSAEGNIMIWGRLLGIAHAGSKGNSKAKISALQLSPVQLRIAKKVARGPKEKTQFGLAEQARIDSEEIIISPLETT